MNKIVLPLIKGLDPSTLAADILSVQPMTGGTGQAMKILSEPGPTPKEGDVMHSLLDGWMVRYGDEWIPRSAWEKIKVNGL